MRQIKSSIRMVGALAVLILAFCSGQEVYQRDFLLNQVTPACIVETPDLENLKINKKFETLISSCNSDINLPSYSFVNKIKCADETRSAIIAPADTTVDIHTDIVRGARLEVGYALDDLYQRRIREPVRFSLWIKPEGEGRFKEIYQDILYTGRPSDSGWHEAKVDLEDYSGRIVLRFKTNKAVKILDNQTVFAYWSNPLVINPAREEECRPKVILISLDTLRADHLKLYRYHRDTAPTLKMFAEDSVVFKNCWSQWYATLQSHHSIMTGLYEVEHMVPSFHKKTPPHLVTLAEVMKNNGYLTAAFTGGALVAAGTGLCKGFDVYFDNERCEKGGFELPEMWLRAKKWLKENSRADFFLFLHTYQIHSPYYTRIARYDKMFKTNKGNDQYIFRLREEKIGEGFDRIDFYNRGQKITEERIDVIQGLQDYYDGSIRYTSEYFLKDLIYCLKELGIYDDTIIVILSDHGEDFFDHRRFYHHDGLYEEYLHVPLLIKFKDSQYKGKCIDKNVETIDVFPTLLEYLGIQLKHRLDGRSLLDLIKGKEKRQPMFAFSQSKAKFAVKRGQKKLLLRVRVDDELREIIPRIEIFDLNRDADEREPLLVDDLSHHQHLYEALYQKLISKKRGIHVVFSEKLKGKTISGEIVIPEERYKLKRFYEVGVTRKDRTSLTEGGRKILFEWQVSSWKKSIILEPGKTNVQITLKLKIDGQGFHDVTYHHSIARQGDFIFLKESKRRKGIDRIDGPVFVFGNFVKWRNVKNIHYPSLSLKNLKKLKTLGYVD